MVVGFNGFGLAYSTFFRITRAAGRFFELPGSATHPRPGHRLDSGIVLVVALSQREQARKPSPTSSTRTPHRDTINSVNPWTGQQERPMFRKIVISVLTKAAIIVLILATLWIVRLWVTMAQARAVLVPTDILCFGVLDIGPVQVSLCIPTRVPTIESTGDGVSLLVPIWVPLVCFTAYPILVLIKTIRRRLRQTPGHCSKCAYNLTGLPEPRCPECGTEFELMIRPRQLRRPPPDGSAFATMARPAEICLVSAKKKRAESCGFRPRRDL